MSYVFYDTETTGTDPAFDQILQFAAIRTDDNFDEIERLDAPIRLMPHVTPSVGALLVNRIAPADLVDPARLSHYDAMRRIHARLLEWSPATFIGYNSLWFDEEMLRHALFQTLHPAYLTGRPGSARSDALRLAYAVDIHAPGRISIPTDDGGAPTFRLERIAAANGYDRYDAHEAMADVEATIFVARLMRDRAPEVWDTVDRASAKDAVMDYIDAYPSFTLSDNYFGRSYSWLVCFCGQNPEYDSEFAVFDLAHDPDEYRTLPVDALVRKLNASPKVIRPLRANRQPIMAPPESAPDNVAARALSDRELERCVAAVRDDEDFQERVGLALAARHADREPSPYVEKQLYDRFPGCEDEKLMAEFHEADWPDRSGILRRIEDPRVREFGWRLIHQERPRLLPEDKAEELAVWRAARLLDRDDSVPWMTVGKALREVDDCLRISDDADTAFLRGVKGFLRALEKCARQG